MLKRREVVLGGLLTIGFMPRCACAKIDTLGCVITDQQLVSIAGIRPPVFGFNIDKDAILNGSGDKDFDLALAITLAKISELFDILPGFAFFNQDMGPNAFASPSKRLQRDDGSVVFGKLMLADLMRSKDNPDSGSPRSAPMSSGTSCSTSWACSASLSGPTAAS